jgi:ABC-type antimicrobial peptide transport system permease subunit
MYDSPIILHVRTSNQPDRIIEAVRRELSAIDPRLPFFEVRTLADQVDATLWSEKTLAWFSSVFSLCALVLASLGLYATLAYAIAQSRREVGIRKALGACAWDILRFFSARPLQFAALGVAAGLAVFCAAGPVFASALYGVSPADPVRLLATTGGVMLVAVAAIIVAVRGAWRLDPVTLLREE